MFALSIDMGGSHVGCAVVNDAQILSHRSLDSSVTTSLESLLPAIAATVRELLSQAGISAADCTGVALGFPGIIEPRSGRILATLKKYEDAKDLDLSSWWKDYFGLEVRIENDARMALLGEHYAGAARGIRDVVMMTLGTGIGGAAMMLGRLVRGTHGQACLGGHLPVHYRGRACVCGNIGCAEAEAAGWSLPNVAREWTGFESSALADAKQVDFRTLFRLSTEGDPVAMAVKEHCLAIWSANVVGLIHAYDPTIVLLGGGVMKSAEIILPHLRRHVAKHAWTAWGSLDMRPASLPDTAALLGAIPLLTEEIP
jgi:glucokinase